VDAKDEVVSLSSKQLKINRLPLVDILSPVKIKSRAIFLSLSTGFELDGVYVDVHVHLEKGDCFISGWTVQFSQREGHFLLSSLLFENGKEKHVPISISVL
jgi:hypothetical protein